MYAACTGLEITVVVFNNDTGTTTYYPVDTTTMTANFVVNETGYLTFGEF